MVLCLFNIAFPNWVQADNRASVHITKTVIWRCPQIVSNWYRSNKTNAVTLNKYQIDLTLWKRPYQAVLPCPPSLASHSAVVWLSAWTHWAGGLSDADPCYAGPANIQQTYHLWDGEVKFYTESFCSTISKHQVFIIEFCHLDG